jgi:hypothetical protein
MFNVDEFEARLVLFKIDEHLSENLIKKSNK